MRGELDKLQEFITKTLMASSEFSCADIIAESSNVIKNLGSKACGLKIKVGIPMPIKASKYAAGPTFSKVSIQILIERENPLALHSPSITYIAESVSKILHNKLAPVECGYGKIHLSESAPWQKVDSKNENVSCLAVNILTQSVLG